MQLWKAARKDQTFCLCRNRLIVHGTPVQHRHAQVFEQLFRFAIAEVEGVISRDGYRH